MASSRFLSRSIDYLGDLGAKLRDLQGYRTLAHELIQNADDAPAEWMSFDIWQDALILDNDGVFADCKDIEASECPWIHNGINDRICDFHRFRLIGTGNKRFQEGTTGAFGIGFITVYQLTDQPEVISAGHHWILHEERSEQERIEVCPGCQKCTQHDLPGTRFIFPFAREHQAPLRLALKVDPVPNNVAEQLSDELEQSLPIAMLFLKNLSKVEVRDSGRLRRTFERAIDDDTIIISQGISANDRVWKLLRGSFQSAAAELRHRHPDRIEEKRSAEVVVALPTEDDLSTGLLCAYLPTEESPGLPFHMNADFFPSSDRKRVILDDDYQSQWNRAALSAAARIVAESTPRLTKMLGAKRFWKLAFALYVLARTTHEDARADVWVEFWTALKAALQKDAVIPTFSGDWSTATSGVVVLQQPEEAPNIPALADLGVKMVAEDLRPYQAILRQIGVPVLDIEILCSALTANGLDGPRGFDELPFCLTSESGRAALWTEIAILLRRRAGTPHARSADEERLRAASLAPAIDKTLRPCQNVLRGDETTVQLFAALGLDIAFLDLAETDFEPLSHLCGSFEVEDAINAIEFADPTSIQQLWEKGRFSLSRLIVWFEERRDQIVDHEDLLSRLAALPIYPSAGQLHPLTSLVLPGDFKDPLGLTSLVDVSELTNQRAFLHELGASELNFRTYVVKHLAKALEDDTLKSTERNAAVTLLAHRLGELKDDDEACQALSSTHVVMCTDGKYHRGKDCYFQDNTVEAVLGNDTNIAILSDERRIAVESLFSWLGVASIPRLHDIVQTVRRITGGPCQAAAIARMQKITTHLSERFLELGDLHALATLEPLKNIEWLPARGNTSQWHQPHCLHAPYQAYLFESQASILDMPSSGLNTNFLEFLGVHINPSPQLVVRHLLYCAKREIPVNAQVYRFLNDNAHHASITQLRSTKCLLLGPAYRSSDHVFWGTHRFGRYRWRLADDLKSYGSLLAKIGVADDPDHEDALDVLREISSEFAGMNKPLDDEAYEVLMGCWQMFEKDLDAEIITTEWFRGLKEVKSIPNKDWLLYRPTWLFFENRAGLSAKFDTFLTNNVIRRQLGTERAFLAAGVRQLGSAVELDLLEYEPWGDDPDTTDRLRQRHNEIARVLSGQLTSQDMNATLAKLHRINCKSTNKLEIRYRLSAFGKEVESEPESVLAFYQPSQRCLWATRPSGQLPWAPLARELAIALLPEEDPGAFAAGLKEVLAAKTTCEAAKILDELGFSRLDTTVVRPPTSLEAAGDLGVEAPIDDDGLPPHHPEDEAVPDTPPEDETGDGTMQDGPLGSIDRTQPPTSPPPESPKPIGIPGEGRAGAGTQTRGPATRLGGGGRTRKGARSGAGRKFVSYIAVSRDDEDEPDPDGLSQQERMDLEDSAINLILDCEPGLERMPPYNRGFDLMERGSDGQPIRWVEVKAMKGTLYDRPVGISRTQFEWGQKHGGSYWLYIVERAGDSKHAQVLMIQDPAGKARTFTFDRGWTAVAKGTTAADV